MILFAIFSLPATVAGFDPSIIGLWAKCSTTVLLAATPKQYYLPFSLSLWQLQDLNPLFRNMSQVLQHNTTGAHFENSDSNFTCEITCVNEALKVSKQLWCWGQFVEQKLTLFFTVTEKRSILGGSPTRRLDTQHNDIQYNDTHHNGLNSLNQHKRYSV